LPLTEPFRPGEHLAKVFRVHGLDEVAVDAGVPTSLYVLPPSVAGDGHEQGLIHARQLPESPGYLEAVHPAPQADVEQGHAGGVGAGRIEGGGAVVGDNGIMTPEPEQDGQGVGRVLPVVKDQDAEGASVSALLCRSWVSVRASLCKGVRIPQE
jgi:hypothetical protein